MATTYDELPIFPLPRLVLMPGRLLPLHVFEPRYRALVRHCVDGDGLMGIATLHPQSESLELPSIYPEIGVGRLVRVEPFPDGRSNIVLEYVQTAHLIEELQSKLVFRQVRAQGHVVEHDSIDEPLRQLRGLLSQLGALNPDIRDEISTLAKLPGAELMDDLAARLLRSDAERRQYTVMGRLSERGTAIVGHLAMSLAGLSSVVGDA